MANAIIHNQPESYVFVLLVDERPEEVTEMQKLVNSPNAMRVLLAIGGSTNGIVHLAAIAGRVGLQIDMQALDQMGRETPVLLDLKPSGQHYMEDFHHAGGMATLLRELKPLLRLDALTVTGRTLGEELERAGPGFKQDVVRSIANPIYPKAVSPGCRAIWRRAAPSSNKAQPTRS